MKVIVKFKSGHEISFKAKNVKVSQNTTSQALTEINANEVVGFPLFIDLTQVECITTEQP